MSDGKVCIYCGSAEYLTSDHVPPKCLFPDPKPNNLITVPACQTCNTGYGPDDELFRLVMATAAYENQVAKEIWDVKVLHGSLKRSPGLKSEVLTRTIAVEQRSEVGLYLGKTPALAVADDWRNRIERVITRIVRGLLWYHYKLRMNPSAKVEILLNPDLTPIRDVIQNDTKLEYGESEVFMYRYGAAVDNPEYSLWLLCFYRKTVFLIFLTP